MSFAYKLGSEAALSHFGLNHGTPKPPATWTQQWQGEGVKNVQKRLTIPSMSEAKLAGFWGEYAAHSALNLGQATRDARYIYDHPQADRVAEPGSAHHLAASVTARIPSLTSNLYYAALPPRLHHTPEDLRGIEDVPLRDWFLHGYKPWKYEDPFAAQNAHLPPLADDQPRMRETKLAGVADALEKFAAAPPRHIMEAVLNRMGNTGHSARALYPGKDLVMGYRGALKEIENPLVPLKTRLDSFKHWKRTGALPQLALGWDAQSRRTVEGINPDSGYSAIHSRSNEPVTVYSGGRDLDLQNAVKNPMTSFDESYVIPGQQHASRHGLYTSHDREAVNPFIGRGMGELTGQPAVAKMTVPRSSILLKNVDQPGYQPWENMVVKGAPISNVSIAPAKRL